MPARPSPPRPSSRRLSLLVALLVGLACMGCEKDDDVTQIRALVEQAVEDAEDHDIASLLEVTTSDFVAGPGRYDDGRVRGVLFVAFRRFGRFEIRHPAPGIRLSEDARSAEVSLPFLVVRQSGDPSADADVPAEAQGLPEDQAGWIEAVSETLGEPYQLDLSLLKDAEGWKVRRAEIRGLRRFAVP